MKKIISILASTVITGILALKCTISTAQDFPSAEAAPKDLVRSSNAYVADPALIDLHGHVAAAGTPDSIPGSAQAQLAGVKRTDLQRHDLSVAGREVIQSRVDIAPGVTSSVHTHPGEEIIYVLEGTFEYKVEGKSPQTLKAGDVLFIPAGTAHSAKNVGSANAAELATYTVEKGKPLVTIVK